MFWNPEYRTFHGLLYYRCVNWDLFMQYILFVGVGFLGILIFLFIVKKILVENIYLKTIGKMTLGYYCMNMFICDILAHISFNIPPQYMFLIIVGGFILQMLVIGVIIEKMALNKFLSKYLLGLPK